MTASMFAAAVSFGTAAAAGATEAPEPAPALSETAAGPVVDSAGAVEKVRGELAAVGVPTPDVDKQVTDTVDDALTSVIPGASTAAEQQAPVPQPPAEHSAQDPNYVWQSDLSSRAMAGKPLEPWVLNRVPGSYFDAPRIPEQSDAALAQGKSLYGPSTPIYVGENTMCTLTVAGVDATGHKVGLTAGHCGEPGDPVTSADSWQVGPSGSVVATDDYHDYAVIEFGSNAELTRSYNGVTVNELGGAAPATGDQLCKQGVATGHDCAITWVANDEVQVTQLCAMAGDSGAPVLAGDRLVGHVSRSALLAPNGHLLSCRTPLQGDLHAPTASTALNPVLADLNARGGIGAGLRLPQN